MLYKFMTIGIDEVGRGALAGPVTVAAVAVPRELRIRNYELGNLKDSKKLSSKKREAWFAFFKNHSQIAYAVARVYPKKIDRINISNAANLAASRAFKKLVAKCQISNAKYRVLLDGGLCLGIKGINQRTIVKGDEKYKAIKIASIIAKVLRDKEMSRLSKKYPVYGFHIHKGYGTKDHIKSIKKHGPSDVHRASFLRFLRHSWISTL